MSNDSDESNATQHPAPESFCVVFDAETDCAFKECPGADKDEKLHRYMQITTLCAAVVPSKLVVEGSDWKYVKEHTKKLTLWRDEAADGCTPFDELLKLFDDAEVIVCFNGLDFDFPLLRRFYRPLEGCSATQRYVHHRSKTLDIMARARDSTGLYMKLDLLLAENGLSTKTGDGLKAISLWRDQKRDELADYCYMDVELTLQLALCKGMHAKGVQMGAQVNSLEYFIKAHRANTRKRPREDLDADEFVIVMSDDAVHGPRVCKKEHAVATSEDVPVMY
jgi:hypothetical protein